jgi:hypothetical protein
VNIFIWSSHKSVDHETNDRVKIHGDGTRADGRRSKKFVHMSEMMRSRVRRPAPSILGYRSNVGRSRAGYLARPGTEAPETRIYFTTHRSGANSVPRVRTVVRGERASRSIVNRTTALWSIWKVSSLVLADLVVSPIFVQTWGPENDESRGSNGISKIAQWSPRRPRWTLPLTNGRKRT